jgi:protoporphyrin/coproporphyrin ferrochelatase
VSAEPEERPTPKKPPSRGDQTARSQGWGTGGEVSRVPVNSAAGILCMAYGSPRTEADVEAYFTDIRGGRPPSPEALEELRSRYRAIGGSPLEEITRRQAAALGRLLGIPAFVGMKHSPPTIADGAAEARAAGIDRLVGLPLAPHFARMSVGQYRAALERAWSGDLEFVAGFHDHPAFIDAICELLREALADGPGPDRLFFTAHSLPCRVVEEGDPYDERLLETCRLVEQRMELPPWEFAFQSASHTGVPWLGPDLLEALERSGARSALVCPIGFVADHLEILYDIDVEAQRWAAGRGVEVRRTDSFNDRPIFIEALAEVVRTRL